MILDGEPGKAREGVALEPATSPRRWKHSHQKLPTWESIRRDTNPARATQLENLRFTKVICINLDLEIMLSDELAMTQAQEKAVVPGSWHHSRSVPGIRVLDSNVR